MTRGIDNGNNQKQICANEMSQSFVTHVIQTSFLKHNTQSKKSSSPRPTPLRDLVHKHSDGARFRTQDEIVTIMGAICARV